MLSEADIFNEPITCEIFIDFLCPFCYRAVRLMRAVQEAMGERLQYRLRFFSLEQVNNTVSGWKLWEQPDDHPSRSLWAFRAAEAARWQGETALNDYAWRLLRARHEERADLADRLRLIEMAREVHLDIESFQADIADPRSLDGLKRDHTEAVERWKTFGVPTFVFGQTEPRPVAYVKLRDVPAGHELRTFDIIHAVGAEHPDIVEIKRPQ